MLFLTKLVPVFIYPLGIALLSAVLAFWLSFTYFRLARFVLAFAIAILWAASLPVVANSLFASLEGRHLPKAMQVTPEADVAILLGGAVGQPSPPRTDADLSDASDRVLHAARLFRAGKVARILVSGGDLPWATTVAPEASLMAVLLVELGVPADAILVETRSLTTQENATESMKVWQQHGFRTGLLVTSGFHMARAIATFKKNGLDVTPAATDLRGTYPLYQSPLDFLPDAAALAGTTIALKEWLGLWLYRLRGWA